MKMFNRYSRRAISPIVATVLIVAVTLVASVAIAGFVFGIFSSQGNTAQVSVTVVNLRNGDFLAAGTTSTFTCGAAAASYITIANAGTAGTSAVAATVTWAGATNSFSLTATSTCAVGAQGSAAGSTQSLLFPTTSKTTVNAAQGQAITGTVTLANGAVLLFSGVWS